MLAESGVSKRKSEQWSVPINVTVSQLMKFGNQPVQFGVGVRYWVDSPAAGPQGWGFGAFLTFLFPK